MPTNLNPGSPVDRVKPTARRLRASQPVKRPRQLDFLATPPATEAVTDTVTLDEPLLTAVEAGELMHIPASTVHYLKDQGVLPYLKIGRAIRFARRDLEQSLASCRHDVGAR